MLNKLFCVNDSLTEWMNEWGIAWWVELAFSSGYKQRCYILGRPKQTSSRVVFCLLFKFYFKMLTQIYNDFSVCVIIQKTKQQNLINSPRIILSNSETYDAIEIWTLELGYIFACTMYKIIFSYNSLICILM